MFTSDLNTARTKMGRAYPNPDASRAHRQGVIITVPRNWRTKLGVPRLRVHLQTQSIRFLLATSPRGSRGLAERALERWGWSRLWFRLPSWPRGVSYSHKLKGPCVGLGLPDEPLLIDSFVDVAPGIAWFALTIKGNDDVLPDRLSRGVSGHIGRRGHRRSDAHEFGRTARHTGHSDRRHRNPPLPRQRSGRATRRPSPPACCDPVA